MRPRRKRKANTASEVQEIDTRPAATPEPEPEPEPRASEELPDGSQRVVISFFLNEKGEVDTERMRESMRKRIGEVFPAMQKQFSPDDSSAASSVTPKIPPSFVSTMLDGFGALQAMIFQRVLEIDEQTARQVFLYSDAEKSQLIPPTVAVLEKRMPEWLLKYKDEFALITLISMIMVSKVQAAKAIYQIRVSASELRTSPAVPEHGPNGAAKQTPPATSAPAGGDEKEAA